MTLQMYNYYKANDPYKGKACMLTGFRCDNKDCTQCVFAKEAYRQALKEKDKRQDRMNSVDEIDRMIDFMKGMDIKAMQDVIQRGVRSNMAGHPRTADASLFIEEHPEMCTYIIGYAAAAMGGEMYRTLMDWLMSEKERSEESE